MQKMLPILALLLSLVSILLSVRLFVRKRAKEEVEINGYVLLIFQNAFEQDTNQFVAGVLESVSNDEPYAVISGVGYDVAGESFTSRIVPLASKEAIEYFNKFYNYAA